ncbi:MAG: AAA family ATPase [Candidatus Saccharimonadales bacterium]
MHEGRHIRTETLNDWEETGFERDITAERVQFKMGELATDEAFHFLGEAESPYERVRKYMNERVIDQPEATEAIVTALEKSFVRPPSDNRPKATLALLGPTGTGKTETARALSESLAEGYRQPNLIKIDGSAYSNGHEMANLLGSPPSYVGSDIKPLLSAENIQRPGTVVLIDEIEKAHPKLHQLLLQIMDDGKIRLNKGEVTNFRDTVVLLTSNLGAQEITKETIGGGTGFSLGEERTINHQQVDNSAKNSFKKHFSPEFTNRIDNLVTFRPLSERALHKVLDVKLDTLNEFYENKFQAALELSPATRERLVAQAAQEPQNGARPLVRALEQQVQAKFGRYIGAEYVNAGTRVHVYHRDELSDEHAALTPDEFVFTAREDVSLLPPPPRLSFESFSPSTDLVYPDLARNPNVAEEIRKAIRGRTPQPRS